MIRVPEFIHSELKKRAKDNHRSMIGEIHYLLFDLEQTHPKVNKNGETNLRHMKIEQKVDLVLQKMKDLGMNSFRQSRSVDGGFGRAGRALGLDNRTIKRYWDWVYENKIVPALEARK